MATPEDPKGAPAPDSGNSSTDGTPPVEKVEPHPAPADAESEYASGQTVVTYGPTVDDPYRYHDDATAVTTMAPAPVTKDAGGGSTQPPSRRDGGGNGGDEEEGMLRMSFLEHLEELRRRIFYVLGGVGVAFVLSLTFCNELWLFVQKPAEQALRQLGINPPRLVAIAPMDQFNIIWMKLPILVSIFIASPWILYQIWAFIAPGLYRRERRWAAPFVIFSAGLFISGGLFAYFVAFRYGIAFLLGIGRDVNVMPMVSMTEYFDLFVNVMLGVALVFEMPVLIFFLTLLHLVTPKFLVNNSRYAILIIVIIAAVVTPTPDVFNLMLFAMPMIMLFYVGVFASWLLVLHREQKKFPWTKVLYGLLVLAVILGGVVYFAITKYGYHLVPHWPFLTR
jgi:sec-independent protein translocase protein TatC